MGPALFDYNMRLIQLSVIQLRGGHCNENAENVLEHPTKGYVQEQKKVRTIDLRIRIDPQLKTL